MESIADDDHRPAASVVVGFILVRFVRLAMIVVAVAPDQHFLQREEQQDAEQHGGAHTGHTGRHSDRFRQNVEEDRTQQRTNGITHQRANPVRARVQREQRRRNDA